MPSLLRQPIVTVLGHVDCGKTTLLDKIRGTAVQLREAGGITQHIGASLFPKETLEEFCGPLLKKFKFKIIVPGLLIIDTPGHEIFSNLRMRGGSASDIAILVVDITKGFQPQTHESLQILVSRKVPFMVAANKVDLIHGWRPQNTLSILESMKHQNPETLRLLDEKIYDIVAALSTYKFDSERFDRVKDFKTTVAIVPVSAKTGEGIQELLTILIGLTQRFMLKKLEVDEKAPAKGSILEISEYPGLGRVLKVIHVDGILKKGATLVAASPNGPVRARIKAILMPAPLDEIRDPRKKFKEVDMIQPASGVIISAPGAEEVYAGSTFYAVPPDEDPTSYIEEIMTEIRSIKVETDKIGVVIKADTLGTLEAFVNYCRNKGIPVRMADVGPVSKTDVVEASIIKEKDELRAVILAFNVPILEDAKVEAENQGVQIFHGKILYRIVEDYLDWINRMITRRKEELFKRVTLPGKIKVLEGFVFRRSQPAIVGIRVLDGRIKPRYQLMNKNGEGIGRIHQIQERKKPLSEATKGMEVAISIREATVGRDFEEGEVLYVDIPERDYVLLKKELLDMLSEGELSLLEEIATIKRKKNPAWGLVESLITESK